MSEAKFTAKPKSEARTRTQQTAIGKGPNSLQLAWTKAKRSRTHKASKQQSKPMMYVLHLGISHTSVLTPGQQFSAECFTFCQQQGWIPASTGILRKLGQTGLSCKPLQVGPWVVGPKVAKPVIRQQKWLVKVSRISKQVDEQHYWQTRLNSALNVSNILNKFGPWVVGPKVLKVDSWQELWYLEVSTQVWTSSLLLNAKPWPVYRILSEAKKLCF